MSESIKLPEQIDESSVLSFFDSLAENLVHAIQVAPVCWDRPYSMRGCSRKGCNVSFVEKCRKVIQVSFECVEVVEVG